MEKSTAGSDVRSNDSFGSTQSNERKQESDFSKENSAKIAVITEALHETIAENEARGKEISDLLSNLDIETKSMSANVQDSWNKVAAVVRAEGLPEVDEVLLKLAMEQKQRDTLKKARDERKMKSRYDKLCQRHNELLKKQIQVGRSTELLQHHVKTEWENNEKEYPNDVHMEMKLNEYHQIAKKLTATLDEQVTPDHYPDKILQKYETYLKLLEESNSLDEELSKYGNLPPNVTEARIRVNEREKYLKELEHTLFEKMKS